MSVFSFWTRLCAFPHRGVGSAYSREAADHITQYLTAHGFSVEKQFFSTPKTYVPIVWLLIGGITLNLLLLPWLQWIGVALVALFAWQGILFLDWRFSWLTLLPPQTQGCNLIAKTPGTSAPRLVLMAHYDSAPVSMLYARQKPGSFRRTIRISMAVMAASVPVALGVCIYPDADAWQWAVWALCLYFWAQGLASTWGFFRFGFTQGASDNATGVAAVVLTALRLRESMPELPFEIALTDAEEVGMIGAYHYYQQKKRDQQADFALLNFDTLGRGQLRYITQTGSLTAIHYDKKLAQAAAACAREERFASVRPGRWHTADFDSAWFARAGMDALTIAALDEAGRMPFIHQPEDVAETVDFALTEQAADFAAALVKIWQTSR